MLADWLDTEAPQETPTEDDSVTDVDASRDKVGFKLIARGAEERIWHSLACECDHGDHARVSIEHPTQKALASERQQQISAAPVEALIGL